MNKFEPTNVDANDERLKITWGDNITHELNSRLLRAACNCASCVSEVTGQRMIDAAKILPSIKITKAEPTGNYAVSLVFSDRHSSGIFTYEYLRMLGENNS